MAEDHALRVLSRAIRDRELAPLLERGVTEEWFAVPEYREIFKYLKRKYAKYGEIPTAVQVKADFINATILRVEDSLEPLLDDFVTWRRQQLAVALYKEGVDLLEEEGDGEAAIASAERHLAGIQGLTLAKSRDVDLIVDPLKRLDAYLERKDRGTSMLGIPSGFPTIDEATAGFQSGQLVTIIAPPKTGKSTLAMQIAVNVHRDHGQLPFFESFEMSNDEQQMRHDAMRANVSHSRLARGTLSAREQKQFEAMLRKMEGDTRPLILSDAAEGLTVSSVQAKITKHRPTIAFIDGVYLMHDEITGERGTPQSLTNITRSLKALAQRNNIPVLISTQVLLWKMKGSKVSADSIGYSSSFYQDSDVILGLEQPDAEVDDLRRLSIVASRNCGPAETNLFWDWDNGKFAEAGPAT